MSQQSPATTTKPFAGRHIGPDDGQVAEMLSAIGYDSLDSLIDAVVPESIRVREALGLAEIIPGAGVGDEGEVLDRLRALAEANQRVTSLIGCGWNGTVTPPVILRNMIENPAWYTAYTPYQPEISQGRLEMLLNFQTVVSDLCGMEMANASMLDEATAAAEAMTLARRLSKVEGDVFWVDSDCHPQVIDVIVGRAQPLGLLVQTFDPTQESSLPDDAFGVLLAYPGSSGAVRDHRAMATAAR